MTLSARDPFCPRFLIPEAARTLKKTGQTSQVQRCFATRRDARQSPPQRWARSTREHGGIENRNHGHRDAGWGEDSRGRVRTANIACALALLRCALRLPALTTADPSLPALAERCAADRRYATALLRKRHLHW